MFLTEIELYIKLLFRLAQRLEKLRRDVEEEDVREAQRHAELVQLRSNVRRNPSWLVQPVVRRSTQYDRRMIYAA